MYHEPMTIKESPVADFDFAEVAERGLALLASSPDQVLEVVEEIRRRSSDKRQLLQADRLELQSMMLTGRAQEALELVPALLLRAEELGVEEVCSTLSAEAKLLLTVGEDKRATVSIERALVLSDEIEEPGGLRASLLVTRGVLRRRSAEFELALADNLEAAELFHKTGELHNYHQTLVNIGSLRIHMGDMAGALESYLKVREGLEGPGNENLLNQVGYNVALIHSRLEQRELAFEELEAVIARCSTTNYPRTLVTALSLAAECALEGGDSPRALGYAERAGELIDSLPSNEVDASICSALANAFRRLGDLKSARHLFDQIATRVPEADRRGNLSTRIDAAHLALDEGDAQQALDALPLMEEEAVPLGNQDLMNRVLELGVEAYSAVGQFELALAWSRKQAEAQALSLRQSGQRSLRSMQVTHEVALARERQRVAEGIQVGLEELVAERTRELREANEKLSAEMAERERTEAERLRLEASLQRSQRLESLGRLAGGVAHDFNNLLMIILNSAQLLGGQLTDPADKSLVEEIAGAARRGATLTAGLLSFGKYNGLSLETFEPDACLRELMKMARRLIGEPIHFDVDLRAAGALIRADRVQFESVILNLMINAQDAMDRCGRLGLRSELIAGGDQHSGGAQYLLIVSDEGHGIDSEHLGLIFDPFFTTKEDGRGTGLGLSMASSTLERFGGSIEVHESSPAGTSMAVRLPIASSANASSPASKAEPEQQLITSPELQGLRLLLVEDEQSVRWLLRVQLEKLGVSVVEMQDGTAALEWMRQTSELPEVIISDVSMPKAGGLQLVDHLHVKGLDIPLLLISGWPDPLSDAPELSVARVGFLQKPFGLSRLREALLELLESER